MKQSEVASSQLGFQIAKVITIIIIFSAMSMLFDSNGANALEDLKENNQNAQHLLATFKTNL